MLSIPSKRTHRLSPSQSDAVRSTVLPTPLDGTPGIRHVFGTTPLFEPESAATGGLGLVLSQLSGMWETPEVTATQSEPLGFKQTAQSRAEEILRVKGRFAIGIESSPGRVQDDLPAMEGDFSTLTLQHETQPPKDDTRHLALSDSHKWEFGTASHVATIPVRPNSALSFPQHPLPTQVSLSPQHGQVYAPQLVDVYGYNPGGDLEPDINRAEENSRRADYNRTEGFVRQSVHTDAYQNGGRRGGRGGPSGRGYNRGNFGHRNNYNPRFLRNDIHYDINVSHHQVPPMGMEYYPAFAPMGHTLYPDQMMMQSYPPSPYGYLTLPVMPTAGVQYTSSYPSPYGSIPYPSSILPTPTTPYTPIYAMSPSYSDTSTHPIPPPITQLPFILEPLQYHLLGQVRVDMAYNHDLYSHIDIMKD